MVKEGRSDIKQRFELLKPFLNERQVRIWTAVESTVIGYGGISTTNIAELCRSHGVSVAQFGAFAHRDRISWWNPQ